MAGRRHTQPSSARQHPPDHCPPDVTPYNIIPIHNLHADHPSLRFPEVRASTAALLAVGDLREPPLKTEKPVQTGSRFSVGPEKSTIGSESGISQKPVRIESAHCPFPVEPVFKTLPICS